MQILHRVDVALTVHPGQQIRISLISQLDLLFHTDADTHTILQNVFIVIKASSHLLDLLDSTLFLQA